MHFSLPLLDKVVVMLVQGDPNQNLKFILAITLKLCISDPILVKPKCVSEAYIYFEKCKQTAEKIVNKQMKIKMNGCL